MLRLLCLGLIGGDGLGIHQLEKGAEGLVLQHGRERLHVLLVEGAAPHAVLVDTAVQQPVYTGTTLHPRKSHPHSQQVHTWQHGKDPLALQEEWR